MTDAPRGLVIAIDGPAASGKSSTARAVAADLGYRHLDSGAFYRAITLAILDRAIPVDRWNRLTLPELADLGVRADQVADGYRLTIQGEPVGERIRTPEVTAHVSVVAAVPAVRDWLMGALRETARSGGLVADGRDIGTVVFPAADLKLFLVCDPEERAARRLREQGIPHPTPAQIRDAARQLRERDNQDESRAVAPLLRAPDAVVLDTTELDFHAQVRAITRLARARISGLTIS